MPEIYQGTLAAQIRANTIQKLQSGSETTAIALTKPLIKQTANASMTRPKAMLLSQAHTLDALFNQLAQKALVQGQMPHYEAFMRPAFKAQSQCRATLEKHYRPSRIHLLSLPSKPISQQVTN